MNLNDPTPVDDSLTSTLATTKQSAVTRSKKGRKKAEITTVEINTPTQNTVLSADDTFTLIVNTLRKDADDRTDSERDLLANQNELVVTLIEKMIEENNKLDNAHNNLVSEVEDKQRWMIEQAKDLFKRSWESHNRTISQLNTLSPEASQLLASAFGSSDPND